MTLSHSGPKWNNQISEQLQGGSGALEPRPGRQGPGGGLAPPVWEPPEVLDGGRVQASGAAPEPAHFLLPKERKELWPGTGIFVYLPKGLTAEQLEQVTSRQWGGEEWDDHTCPCWLLGCLCCCLCFYITLCGSA